MASLRYTWNSDGTVHTFELVYVEGTNGSPYAFGEGTARAEIEIPAFFIGTVPVTQVLWTHVVGTNSNPAAHRGLALPIENVSWDAITQAGGFLDLINESRLRKEVLAQLPAGACFGCPRRRSGNSRLGAAPFAAMDSASAAATILTR